jgi:transmembrane sensor
MGNGKEGKGNGRGGMGPGQKIGRNQLDRRVPDEDPSEGINGRSPVDDLIIKILRGAASPFEDERLKRWREAAPENEEYFQEMAQVWGLTAPEPAVPASGPPTVEEVLAAAPFAIRPKPAPNRPPWLTWGLLAASVAAVGLGINVLVPFGPDPFAVHQSAQNQNLTVTLADGSFVRLAGGSTLQEWEVEGRREVSLDGRAFFAIARDEANPFVVRAGATEVRVLGTRFQVDTQGDEVRTVVVEGLVRVSNDEGSAEVSAGYAARMIDGEGPSVREVENVFALLDWSDGTLLFHATPLAQVADEVSRHYGRTLEIAGSDLAQRRVTAWFQGESFEAVAESLCIVTEAACRTEGESVSMESGGSEGTNGNGGAA